MPVGLDITEEEEPQLFAFQEGNCYLCGQAMKGDDVHLDHDHAINQPRAWPAASAIEP